ncbi:hypothetical protein G7Y89_g4891 [Cudoniella acicularis]|uniref:Uncharacterized protein n=1 Tax=Cudoniella acicularis TaxID=354080 RepID=A0A8H4RNI8_9HELO|nr:hypothetical protein G7Y89_g4891 [Cudoniella acicularis]
MAPKKANLPKEQLQKLVADYNLKFEGPVPPKQWPTQYSHLFQVIRNIWANRYDDYIIRTDTDQKTVRRQKARVRDLRTNVSRLRTDFGINEDIWRDSIEKPVIGRNENWESEYEAQPFDEDEKKNWKRDEKVGAGARAMMIVDFVWTWARDVYRPQVRRCLDGHVAHLREISPTSTNPFSRLQSVFSVPSARSFSQPLLDTILEDNITAQEVVIEDASSHPFLRWADRRDVSTPWTFNTSMRHSDIVMFSFRILEIPETQESFHDLIYSDNHENSAVMLHALKVILQNHITSHPDQRVKTLLLFRTFCQQEDWQLKQEAYCVIWSSRAASLLSIILETDIYFSFDEDSLLSIQYFEFIQAFQQLHKLSGKQSVAYALQNTSLILLPCNDASGRGSQLQWRQPQSQGIPEHVIKKTVALFDSASCSEDVVQSYHHQRGRLLWVLQTEEATDTPPDLIRIPDEVGEGGAMLAVKPGAWPQQCPRFCLFVLLDHRFLDEARLGGLLRYKIHMRDMYCVYEDTAQEPEALSAADRHFLRCWEDSFSRETMPRG